MDLDIINRSARFNAGPGMNNSISLAKTINNEIRVMVCNNDQTVCILSVPNMEKVCTLKMPAAINHSKFVTMTNKYIFLFMCEAYSSIILLYISFCQSKRSNDVNGG